METSLALKVRGCDTGVALCSVAWGTTLGVMGKTGRREYLKEMLPITGSDCPAKRV